MKLTILKQTVWNEIGQPVGGMMDRVLGGIILFVKLVVVSLILIFGAALSIVMIPTTPVVAVFMLAVFLSLMSMPLIGTPIHTTEPPVRTRRMSPPTDKDKDARTSRVWEGWAWIISIIVVGIWILNIMGTQ